MKVLKALVLVLTAVGFLPKFALAEAPFKKAFIVILENTDYKDAVKQPFMSRLAAEGALLEQMYAVARPSQPNYIALTSGSTWGVATNKNVDLDVRHIGNLLEEKGMSWKLYADGYPGNCFLGAYKGKYGRKHVPFLSYKNVQNDPARCARVVNAEELKTDLENEALADVSFFIPDDNNNGHDTGVAFADRYLEKTFGPLLTDERFTRDMLLVVTFDESSYLTPNRIYTSFWGAGVRPGTKNSARYTLYSLLRTIEDAFGLGTLGKRDAEARPITGIWQ